MILVRNYQRQNMNKGNSTGGQSRKYMNQFGVQVSNSSDQIQSFNAGTSFVQKLEAKYARGE